jgi:hypothetical protein
MLGIVVVRGRLAVWAMGTHRGKWCSRAGVKPLRKGRAVKRIRLTIAIAAMTIVGLMTPATANAASNNDAAHACQQGGYASLYGRDQSGATISFNNAGECVSYAAQGGVFVTPLAACTVTATSGCITLDGAPLSVTEPDGSYGTLTVSGVVSFDSSCVIQQCFYGLPNTNAQGGGTFLETDSTGATVSRGTFSLSGFNQGGLVWTSFENWVTPGMWSVAPSCSAASNRVVMFNMMLTDSSNKTRVFGLLLDTQPDGAGSTWTYAYLFGVGSGHQTMWTGAPITC